MKIIINNLEDCQISGNIGVNLKEISKLEIRKIY
jgi:hypothetical protein